MPTVLPIRPFPAYGSIDHCPKCHGLRQGSLMYPRPAQETYVGEGPWSDRMNDSMKITCGRCGFIWFEEPCLSN